MKSIAFLTARYRISHEALLLSLVSIVLLSGSGLASADCYYDTIRPSTWQTRFINNGDGTVTDKATGLQWKRCAEGQVWDGTTCTGSASTFYWKDALQRADQASFGGYDDWRLPNIKELSSIIEVACSAPYINEIIFQQTPSGRFFSSSPKADSSYVWCVSYSRYGDNLVDGCYKASSIYVRLVRSAD